MYAIRSYYEPVLHRAAVDEEVLVRRGALVEGRQSGVAGEAQTLALDVHLHRRLAELAAQKRAQAGVARAEEVAGFGGEGEALAPVVRNNFV